MEKQKLKLTVVKVGGKILEEETSLNVLLHEFTDLEGLKVLVHGGGRTATALASRLGIETKMIDGRRVTDENMLRVVTMAYGGLVNKTVVARLNAMGVMALGLTGADANVILSHKRPVKTVDYGFVGDVEAVADDILVLLLQNGIVPVMAPLTHDGFGQLLNTNADTIAAATAKALASHFDVTLTFCFEKRGVLRNPDDDDSVIPRIDASTYQKLKNEGIIQGGMIPKIENSFDALRSGVRKVVITRVGQLGREGEGTTIEL